MPDWGQGYQVGVPYVVGFFPELAPTHLEAALLFSGYKVDLARPGAAYCELGCGYGLSTLLLAAANPQMRFVGIDFIPTHIVAARSLAQAADLHNISFIEANFSELLTPRFDELGEFDVIALHGTYSWVAPAVRRSIVEVAAAKLKTGGVLYVSYNSAPGWTPRAPLQWLLYQHAKRSGAAPESATADAVRFAKTVKDAGAKYFAALPQVCEYVETMQKQDLKYLMHEHMNENWSALYHADVVADFSRAKLSYACAGHIADDLSETSVPPNTHHILSGIGEGAWRETLKDFLVGRSFRRDIFVRGPVRMTHREGMAALEPRTFMLVVPRASATTTIATAVGEVAGRADVFPQILDLLARGPARLSELHDRATGPAKEWPALIQALALLVHSGQVRAVRADVNIDAAPAQRLNLALAREIEAGRAMQSLAAPAIGTAVPVTLPEFGLLLAQARGLPLEAGAVAKTTWEMIAKTSVRPLKDGKALQNESEATAHFAEACERIIAEKLDILRSLGILDAKANPRRDRSGSLAVSG